MLYNNISHNLFEFLPPSIKDSLDASAVILTGSQNTIQTKIINVPHFDYPTLWLTTKCYLNVFSFTTALEDSS